MVGCKIKNCSRLLYSNAPDTVIPGKCFTASRGNYSTHFAFTNCDTPDPLVNNHVFPESNQRCESRTPQNFHSASFILSLNVLQFSVIKLAEAKSGGQWVVANEQMVETRYGASRCNVRHDSKNVHYVTKNWRQDHRFVFSALEAKSHKYFSAEAQPYLKVLSMFSSRANVQDKNTDEPKINIYPKASNEVVGTKFVNVFSGKILNPNFQYTRSDSFFAKKFRFMVMVSGKLQRYSRECIG
jgi:hypothetical protein